jgi:peptidoglycan hydrolase-like protein with peptidoglycan-binding domain
MPEVKPQPNDVIARPALARSNDPIAELLAPSQRVLAVQKALADFGYGQIRPTGVAGPDTKAAIEKFERDHHMPVTGQISDRLLRDLGTMTGRALD